MSKPPTVSTRWPLFQFLGIVIPAALSGCGGGGLGATPTISGRLEAWTMGPGSVLQALAGKAGAVVGSGPIAADGSFTITLSVPNELQPYGPDVLCSGSSKCQVQSTPAQVMYSNLGFGIPNIGAVVMAEKRETNNMELAYFQYVDADISVTGTYQVLTYDMRYKTGWNILVGDTTATAVNFSIVQNTDDFKWYWANH